MNYSAEVEKMCTVDKGSASWSRPYSGGGQMG